MIKRFSFLAAAVVAAMVLSAPSYAGTIPVHSDAGGGTVDVLGTATGVEVTTNSYTDDVISSVNALPVPFTLAMDYTITGPDDHTVTGGGGSKTISFGSDAVTLLFSISTGIVSGSHLNADGTITGFASGSGTTITFGGNTYDFKTLIGGGISLSNDKAFTDYTKVFHHAGTTALASGGGVHQASVPEPASMAMLGIGMTGLLAFRRLFRRAKA
jgi:hypothetical protein